MKKSKLKILVLPIAVASASVIGMVSGTLAYFTSMDKATVSIEAGQVKVDMNFDADSLKLYSLDVERDALIFENGGTASLGEGNVLSLDKITPGDKVTFNVKLTNSSNVDAKYVLLADFADEVEGKNRTDAGKVVPHAGDTITGTKVLSEGLVVKDGENDLTSGIAFVALEASQVITKTITVELPKEAGNEYQGAQSKIVFKVIALQKNAPMTPELYLEIANAHTKKHAHPTAAIEKLSADGMDFLAELETGGILEDYAFFWNQADGDFYSGSPASVAEWKFVDAVSGIGTSYSSYLLGDSLTGDIVTAAGIDVGENSSINSVSYIRTTGEAQEVAIRTNSLSTTVTVNAPNDVVKHYGNAGSLNIIAVADSSYHEYGKVAFAEISKGRIALEAGADVTQLHISSIKENEVTTNQFDEIIVSIDENVTKPKFSRDDVAIDDNGTLVVAIQEGTEAVTDATDLDYVWLTKQGIYEQIKVSDNNQSTADAKWADDASLDNTNTQEVAYDIANNIGRNTTTNKVEDTVTFENEIYDVSLDEETRDLVVKQNDEVIENQETVAEVIGGSVEKTGLSETEKAAAKEEVVEEVKDEQAVDSNYVVRVNETYYDSFDSAFSIVESGDTMYIISDCSASSVYDFSGKNVSIFVKENATLSCGNVTNGKFEIGYNNAAGTLTLEGEGKITFNSSSQWGLITQNGSGNNIKAVVKNVTIAASAANGFISEGNLTLESGYFKNIAVDSDTIIKGGYYTVNPSNADVVEGKMVAASNNPEYPYFIDNLDAAHANYALLHGGEYSYYSTLFKASKDAKSGDTLRFIGEDTSITLNQNNNKFWGVNGVTYDLNSHTLVGGTQFPLKLFYLNNGDSVTIQNGKIDVPAGYFCDSGNFTINSVNVSYADAIADDVLARSNGVYVKDEENFFSMKDAAPEEYIARIDRDSKSYYFTRAGHGVADALATIKSGDIVYVNAYEADAKATLMKKDDSITIIRSSSAIEFPLVEAASGDVKVTVNSEDSKTYTAVAASICQVGTTKCATLDEAIAAIASNGGTITLLKDIAFASGEQILISSWTSEKTYVLELNGHTITHPGGMNALFKVNGTNGGTYVFQDSVGGGGMKATNSNFYSGLISIGNGKTGKVKFYSGLYDNLAGKIVHRLNATVTTEVYGGVFSEEPRANADTGFSTDSPSVVQGTYAQNTEDRYWYQH